MPDRIHVHVDQVFQGFWCLLIISPEPAAGNARVCFRDYPHISIRISDRISACDIVIIILVVRRIVIPRFVASVADLGPCLISRIAIFIADPSDIRMLITLH